MAGRRIMDESAPPAPWTSSSATCCGVRHTVNEDAALELTETGVFAVADGMGGHTDGALASRSIVEIIRHVSDNAEPLDDKVANVEAALHSINGALRREAAAREGDVVIGSTVAALVLDADYAVCIWSGDSRIYLLRAGHLYQLTRDHSLDGHSGGILTRAVGSSDVLELDRLVTAVQPDDTFLICSDGITKVVTDHDLGLMLADPIEGLAARVVAQAVALGTTDDASAVLVRYSGQRP